MTCPNCERLEAQLTIARKELAFRGLDMRLAALMVRVGCEPAGARVLLSLYDHQGIMEAPHLAHRAGCTEGGLKQHVMRLRALLGETSIIAARHGGYSLSIPAHSMAMAALEPVDLQAVRP